MVCIYCGQNTRVINSRVQKRRNQTWRRRRCIGCRSIFTTLESVDWYSSLAVNKKTGLEPFLRDKLFMSILDSLKHRKNATDSATSLTGTVISKLLAHNRTAVVESVIIIQVTSEALRHFDHAAYTHYTAYHPI